MQCKKCDAVFSVKPLVDPAADDGTYALAGPQPESTGVAHSRIADEPPDLARELSSLMSGSALPRPATEVAEHVAGVAAPPKSRSPRGNPPARVIGERRPSPTVPDGVGGTVYPVGGIIAYIAAVRRSCFSLLRPLNLVTLGLVALSLVGTIVLSVVGLFGLVGQLIIWGYFAAFMLNAVQDAAAGEEDLTQPDVAQGLWDGLFQPAMLYGAANLLVLLPVIGFVAYRVFSGAWSGDDTLALDGFAFIRAAAPPQEFAFTIVLYALGIFLWPMVLLVVAVGGSLTELVRFDLILRTIRRTLPGYCIVVLCVYGSQLIPVGADVLQQALQGELSLLQLLGFALLKYLAYVYSATLAMRAAGLYYHHFKSRFAWSWG